MSNTENEIDAFSEHRDLMITASMKHFERVLILGTSAKLSQPQELKAIFLALDRAEKWPEPKRSQELRRIIEGALEVLEGVKMPEKSDTGIPASQLKGTR